MCGAFCRAETVPLCTGMQTKSKWSPGSKVKVLDIKAVDDGWMVSAIGPVVGTCPDCGRRSRHRHGWGVGARIGLVGFGQACMIEAATLFLSRAGYSMPYKFHEPHRH
ncbi:MAG: hypothetical protein ACR2RE_26135, partial [Geminicoccaceae bacterium]